MEITRGKIETAQKVIVYGPEGIGKSTFASKFPGVLFIDTEGSTKKLDVPRLPKPSSWTMLMEQVRYVKSRPDLCKTLIIDTADWAEKLCSAELCSKSQKNGIEDFGYGKGYVYLEEEFGRLLNLLEDLIDIGINVVFTAHAQMRKFEQPDEMGAYDRWEMKLQKKTAPLLREWADMVLFANYKTYVINVDGQGVQKGKNKAQGGKRVMHTTHHNCWDAKNRDDLPEELDFDYSKIAHCIPTEKKSPSSTPKPTPEPVKTEVKTELNPEPVQPSEPITEIKQETIFVNESKTESQDDLNNVPKALADLMKANNVTVKEIQEVVASRGYYPADTPIENYDAGFISGVLVAAWPQVFSMIQKQRKEYAALIKEGKEQNPFIQ